MSLELTQDMNNEQSSHFRKSSCEQTHEELCLKPCDKTKVRPSQGFWGFREKGYLFSGIWGEGSFIFRDLGRFWAFREQGAGGLRKNILGSWGERSFFFQGAGNKDPPPPPGGLKGACYLGS